MFDDPTDPAQRGDLEQSVVRARLRQEMFGSGRPKQLGRFELIRSLGEGGMGTVYLGRDPDLERDVAIKVLHDESAEHGVRRKRLVREAKSLARLHHPNVVQVFEVGVDGGQLFIVMELVRGRTLRKWLDECDASWSEVLQVMRQAGEALAAAHDQGLVHRDFKPANVMIDEDGRVRVLDFGLARDAIDDDEPRGLAQTVPDGVGITRTGTVLGTPAYMAPEQHGGRSATHRSDQFAFCVTLFEGLFAAHPFEAASYSELAAKVSDGRHRKAGGYGVPSSVVKAVARGLRPQPEDRHSDMRALLDHLDTKPRARPWMLGAAALALGAALGGGWALAGVDTGAMAAPVVADPVVVCKAQAHAQARAWEDRLEPALLRQASKEDWSSLVKERLLDHGRGWTEQQAALCSLDAGAIETSARRECVEVGAAWHSAVAGYIVETAQLEPAVRELLAAGLDEPSGCESPESAPLRPRLPASVLEASEVVDAWARFHRRGVSENPHDEEGNRVGWSALQAAVSRQPTSPAQLELLATIVFRRLAYHTDPHDQGFDGELERSRVSELRRQAQALGSTRALHWITLSEFELIHLTSASRGVTDGEGRLRALASSDRDPELAREALARLQVRSPKLENADREASLLREAELGEILARRSPLLEWSDTHRALAVLAVTRGDFDAARGHLQRSVSIAEIKVAHGIPENLMLVRPVERYARAIDSCTQRARKLEAQGSGDSLVLAEQASRWCCAGQFAQCRRLARRAAGASEPVTPTAADWVDHHFGGVNVVNAWIGHRRGLSGGLDSALFRFNESEAKDLQRSFCDGADESSRGLAELPDAVSGPMRARVDVDRSYCQLSLALRGTEAERRSVRDSVDVETDGLALEAIAVRRLAIGLAHEKEGDLEAAREMLRAAHLSDQVSRFGLLRPPYVALLWLSLADVHLRLGELNEARPLVRDGWALVQRFDGSDRLTRELALRLLDALELEPQSIPPANSGLSSSGG